MIKKFIEIEYLKEYLFNEQQMSIFNNLPNMQYSKLFKRCTDSYNCLSNNNKFSTKKNEIISIDLKDKTNLRLYNLTLK